jgi:hypothetical protein
MQLLSNFCFNLLWLLLVQLVESWDQEMRARLLQFVTGTSKVHFLQRFNMGDGYFCETCLYKNVLTGGL